MLRILLFARKALASLLVYSHYKPRSSIRTLCDQPFALAAWHIRLEVQETWKVAEIPFLGMSRIHQVITRGTINIRKLAAHEAIESLRWSGPRMIYLAECIIVFHDIADRIPLVWPTNRLRGRKGNNGVHEKWFIELSLPKPILKRLTSLASLVPNSVICSQCNKSEVTETKLRTTKIACRILCSQTIDAVSGRALTLLTPCFKIEVDVFVATFWYHDFQ